LERLLGHTKKNERNSPGGEDRSFIIIIEGGPQSAAEAGSPLSGVEDQLPIVEAGTPPSIVEEGGGPQSVVEEGGLK